MNARIDASLPWSDGSGPSYENGYTDLASGIVLQAVRDYMDTLQNQWKKDLAFKEKQQLIIDKAELESFFHSSWFEFLTDLDPDRLMEGCRQRAMEQQKEKIQTKNRKRVKDLRKAEEGGSKQ